MSAFPAVIAGIGHTCVIMSASGGKVRCFGYNSFGQLGNGRFLFSEYELPTTDVVTGAVRIADAGYFHTCVLMGGANGVRCWGKNDYGQLGIGSTGEPVNTPPSSDISALTGVAQIVAGFTQTCVLLGETRGVRCWGGNDYGELGIGSTTLLTSPPTTSVVTGVLRIAAGGYHTCVIMMATNGVRCWGRNDRGQLGIGNLTSLLSPPTTDVLTGVSQVAAGWYFTCALMTINGGVRCWGYNDAGQLGIGDNSLLVSPPTTNSITGAVQIAAGGYHTCALLSGTNAGRVRCWGHNQFGQLGLGYSPTSLPYGVLSPPSANIADLTGVTQITAGELHTCVLIGGTNKVGCWGRNNVGQLGLSPTGIPQSNKPEPSTFLNI